MRSQSTSNMHSYFLSKDLSALSFHNIAKQKTGHQDFHTSPAGYPLKLQIPHTNDWQCEVGAVIDSSPIDFSCCNPPAHLAPLSTFMYITQYNVVYFLYFCSLCLK